MPNAPTTPALEGTSPPPAMTLDLLVAVAVSAAYFAYYQFSSSHLCGTDPYYHIKFAELTRIHGPILDFPWAQWSSWKEAFFDKEVLYHLYLSLFTFGDLMVGAKIANTLLGAAIFTSFMYVLRAHRIRWPWMWWFLLLSSGGYFLFRMNVTRPQVFSVLILIWALHFLLLERHHLVGLFALIYSLSYTGHYQYVGLAFGFVGVVYLAEKRLPWRVFVWALGGMVLGWVVHPNFPHNVAGFYLQNIQVIASHWAPKVNLNMGGELNPMTTRSLLGVCGATIIPLWLIFSIAITNPPKVDTKTKFLFAASTVYLVMTLFTKRFAEYWIPVTGLFIGFYCSPILANWSPVKGLYRFFSERRVLGGFVACALFPVTLLYLGWALLAKPTARERAFGKMARLGGIVFIMAICAGLGALFINSHFDTYPQVSRCGDTTYGPSARFVRDHIPKRSRILTCDWDDAPYIFYYSANHYYTVFLDPNFMYLWRPDIWRTWDKLTHAKDPSPRATLIDVFQADYVYCTGDFGAFRGQLQRTPGMTQVYPPLKARLDGQECLRCEGAAYFDRCQLLQRCRSCRHNRDCARGEICHEPKGPDGKLRPRRCAPDPHVFIFKVK